LVRKPSIEGGFPKRKPDTKLWEEVRHLAEGSANDRLRAVDISFDGYYKLPEDVDYLLLKLADSRQPEHVRIRIAEKVASMTALPTGLYFDLLKILDKDPSPGVKQIVGRETERVREMTKPAIEALAAFQKQMSLIGTISLSVRDEWFRSYQARVTEIVQALGGVEPFYPRDLQNTILDIGKIYEEQARTIARDVTSFYSSQDLLSIRGLEPSKRPKNPLIRKLSECPVGRAYWKEYQGICREVLEWLLVPPLSPPFEEVTTGSGLQKRDFIFPIPSDVAGFWYWIRLNHHSSAVIVECKNYTDFIPPNGVTVTSKYFGEKRCGLFGVLVTRKGLSNSAKKEQERLWLEDDKMIVCLSDEDLMKMISLRDSGHDTELVLDEKISRLRMSLE